MIEHLGKVLKLVRITHWVKNIIIVFPLFFAGHIDQALGEKGIALLTLFFLFSLASSVIYVLNDIQDRKEDQLHQIKRHRPIASGYFSVQQGYGIAAICALLFSILSLTVSPSVLYFVLGYLALNVCYIYVLKNVSIIDVSCISTGFVLRILAGGMATQTEVSHWMVIMTFLLTVSIAFAKRRDDIILREKQSPNADKTYRKVQEEYSIRFLDVATSICFAITILAYIMYTLSDEVNARLGSDILYISALPVFLGVMRYLQLTIVKEKSMSPTKILFQDRVLQGIILSWICLFFVILYVQ